jgi:hypothetical protein
MQCASPGVRALSARRQCAYSNYGRTAPKVLTVTVRIERANLKTATT